jgi:hypothetical protein
MMGITLLITVLRVLQISEYTHEAYMKGIYQHPVAGSSTKQAHTHLVCNDRLV